MLTEREVTCHIGVPSEEAAVSSTAYSSAYASEFLLGRRRRRTTSTTTVDYAVLSALVEGVAQSRTWKLVETLAHRIAQDTLTHFPVHRVTVTIQKPVAARALQAREAGLCRNSQAKDAPPRISTAPQECLFHEWHT